MKINLTRKTYRVLFIIWSVIIITATSYPEIQSRDEKIIGLDKIFHFAVYLIFAYLFIKMHGNKISASSLKILLILSLVVPLADEIHQIPIPGRFFSWADLLADFLGFMTIFIYFKSRYRISLKSTQL